ncbi:hypothetical protein [Flavobacterium sp.]
MKISVNNINTGKILEKKIREKNLSNKAVGEAINRNGLSVFKYMANQSLQTAVLIDFCYALNHNFFSDIADQLPLEFTKNQPRTDQRNAEKEERIAQLEEENKVLKIQNDILLKVRK